MSEKMRQIKAVLKHQDMAALRKKAEELRINSPEGLAIAKIIEIAWDSVKDPENICEMNARLANYLIGRLATLAEASMGVGEKQLKAYIDALKSIVWDVERERAEAVGKKELDVEPKVG